MHNPADYVTAHPETTFAKFCDMYGRPGPVYFLNDTDPETFGPMTMKELWYHDDDVLSPLFMQWAATRPSILTEQELRRYARFCIQQAIDIVGWRLEHEDDLVVALDCLEDYCDLSPRQALAIARKADKAARAMTRAGTAWEDSLLADAIASAVHAESETAAVEKTARFTRHVITCGVSSTIAASRDVDLWQGRADWLLVNTTPEF